MTWVPSTSVRELHEAIGTFDRPRVAQLCDELVAHLRGLEEPYMASAAMHILGMLRRGRYFHHLQRVADALIQSGRRDPTVRRQYAQSLLDQGLLAAAVAVLERLRSDAVDADADEHREATGLLGRAYKQMYVTTGPSAPTRRQRFMEAAIAAYHEVVATSPQARWHAVNIVALLYRADRDGVAVAAFPEPRATADALAARIVDQVEALGERAAHWDLATAMEACVALDRQDEAASWLNLYLLRPHTDAFELASTLRQLTEVWQLSPTHEPGRRLIPILQAELLRREGGEVDVTASEAAHRAGGRAIDLTLERVFGSERFTTLTWFRKALERCRAVARVEERGEFNEGVGTGFLVAGSSLHPDLPDLVLFTNAHVLGDPDRPEGKAPAALDPRSAAVTFRAGDGAGAHSHEIAKVVWSSPPTVLDVTVAALASVPDDAVPLPLAAATPRLTATDEPPQTYIIGHPRGKVQPMFSIRDNLLLGADDTRVHYRTPTEGGSSGSPVFNADWEVIAVHHGGGTHMAKLDGGTGTYEANEGIWITRVANALAAEL